MRNDTSVSKAGLNFFKLIFLLAGLAVALYLALNRVKFQNKAAQYPATLVFAPSTATVTVGSTFQAPILLNTGGGNIRGVDVQITFDKTKLRLTAINPNAASATSLKTFAPVATTNTFDTPTVINNANTNGTIEFGAVTSDMSNSTVTASYNGSTVLATLTFQGVLAGSTSVNFNPVTVPSTNLTKDTNIVVDSDPPVDTLSSVTNLTVNVTSTSPTPTLVAILPNCKNLTGSTTIVRGNSYTYAVTSDNLSGVGKVDNLGLAITRNNCAAPSDTLYWTDRWTKSGLGTVANTTYSFTIDGTKTATLSLGQYTLDCRAWNDSVAECRGACYGTGKPIYQCRGPNTSLTVSVVDPTITPSPTTGP